MTPDLMTPDLMTPKQILRALFPTPLRVVLCLYGLSLAGALAYVVFRP